jgi:hypothetical protein
MRSGGARQVFVEVARADAKTRHGSGRRAEATSAALRAYRAAAHPSPSSNAFASTRSRAPKPSEKAP